MMQANFDEFRTQLIEHAKRVAIRLPKIENEASTKTSLVQPFLLMLGYDVGDPDQVALEHHADYAKKYPNKVDYAILHNKVPVIAIESKRAGSQMKDDAGQLRSYFHACETVKLGILTDGVRYEFYADSDKPNIMDDTAFLRIDFTDIANSQSLDDNTLQGIAAIRYGHFNPGSVGTEAKRKLLLESIVESLKELKKEPSDDFVRFILDCPQVGVKFVKTTQKIIDAHRDVIRSAMEAFVEREVLARLGYAPKDVVKTAPSEPASTPVPAQPTAVEPEPDAHTPSEAELAVFSEVKNRLLYLVKGDTLYQELQKLKYRKNKTSFRVYYDRPNNGSIFDYKTGKGGKIVLQFPALDDAEIACQPSPELDDHLLKVFKQRVSEAGVALQASTVLHAIPGGR